MADIQAGTTYADGGQVTAVNLNAHVNNATLVPGVISDKTAAASVTGADSILILQSATLKKATISQVQTAIAPDLTPYINRNGSVAMTAELTLSSATPAGSLSAAPKQYVDTGLATKQASLGFTPVNKAGDTGVGPLALAVDPVSALQVTTKQYVDNGLAGKQASLGFTPINKAGDTGVGSLTIGAGNTLTLAADPAQPLQASTKAYVDTQIATRAPAGGGTLTGTYLFSGKLQTSTAPTVANDVVTKGYLESVIDVVPQPVASACFATAIVPSVTVDTSRFLTVTATRTAGSSTMTVNYGGLAARYYDPVAPFFLQYQYVGIDVGTAGVTGRLYQITSTNLAARTFTITTPETTVFNGGIQLSLIYDSTNLRTGEYGFNVKGIFMDMTAISKYYVNYIRDIISGESAPATPANTPVKCDQVSGSANTAPHSNLNAISMRNVGRTDYIYNQDIAEGFGSNSLGNHIGLFYTNADGSPYPVWAASFLITAYLPPA